MIQYIKRLSYILLACMICLAAASGCSSETPQASGTVLVSGTASATPEEAQTLEVTDAPAAEPETELPVTITGFDGFEVTVPAAERIVSLCPSTTSTLVQVGALDSLVGVDDASRGAGDAQKVGSEEQPDTEAIAALSPDIVFSGRSTAQEAVDALRASGIVVLCAEAQTFGEVPDSFLMVGQATGHEAAGAALVAQLQTTIEDVAAARPASTPSCYYVISFGSDGNWTSGPGSLMNSVIEAAGGSCVTVGGPAPQFEYPVDELMQANPDCIIYASNAGAYSTLISSPGYKDLDAVKNGMVFAINANTVSEAGTNLNEALLSVSSILREAAQGPVSGAGEETAEDETAG